MIGGGLFDGVVAVKLVYVKCNIAGVGVGIVKGAVARAPGNVTFGDWFFRRTS